MIGFASLFITIPAILIMWVLGAPGPVVQVTGIIGGTVFLFGLAFE